MNYYFLASLLPRIEIGHPPSLHFEELKVFLKANLTPSDFSKVTVLCRIIDIYNLQAIWRGQKIDLHGNFTLHGLEQAIQRKEGLPKYVLSFLNKYVSTEDCLKNFPRLIRDYFKFEIPLSNGFLRTYLLFERDLRLIMLGFRAKLLGRDIAQELQHEDPESDLIVQILSQRDSKDHEPPEGFDELRNIFTGNNPPLTLHREICEYKFNKVQELIEYELVSIDKILGYVLQVILVEQWQWLDVNKEEGEALIKTQVVCKTFCKKPKF